MQVYRQTSAKAHPSPPEEDGEAVLEGRQRQHMSVVDFLEAVGRSIRLH